MEQRISAHGITILLLDRLIDIESMSRTIDDGMAADPTSIDQMISRQVEMPPRIIDTGSNEKQIIT